MRLLVTYLLTEEEEDKLVTRLMDLLFEFLSANGATFINDDNTVTESKDNTTTIDRGYIKSWSARMILKLARLKPFEKAITLERFQKLATVAQDPLEEVRDEMLGALLKGLKDVRLLPLRFLSILALYGLDPSKEVVTKVSSLSNMFGVTGLGQKDSLSMCRS